MSTPLKPTPFLFLLENRHINNKNKIKVKKNCNSTKQKTNRRRRTQDSLRTTHSLREVPLYMQEWHKSTNPEATDEMELSYQNNYETKNSKDVI